MASANEPDESAERFSNERDDKGNPICPVCSKPIIRGGSAARGDGFLVHIECWARKAGAGDTSA
jgi:hypothetical protein